MPGLLALAGASELGHVTHGGRGQSYLESPARCCSHLHQPAVDKDITVVVPDPAARQLQAEAMPALGGVVLRVTERVAPASQMPADHAHPYLFALGASLAHLIDGL